MALPFSPIQVGKEHLYYLLQKLGLTYTSAKATRPPTCGNVRFLTKTKQKDKKKHSIRIVWTVG